MDEKQLGMVSSSSFPSYSQRELGSFYTTRKDEIFKDVFEDFQNYIYENLDNLFIQSIFIKNNTKQSIHETIQIYLMEKH